MFFFDFHPENWGRFERAYFSKGWVETTNFSVVEIGANVRCVGKVWVNCWEIFCPSNQFTVLFFVGKHVVVFWGALVWIVLANWVFL